MDFLKNKKMKKIILFAFLVIFSLSAFAIAPDLKSKSENPAIPDKKENNMSEEEMIGHTKRTEEIRDADKSQQAVIVQEGHRSRRGHRGHDGMNENPRRNGTVLFVSGGSVLLLVILLIILI
jgi:hypothetical protein